MSTLTFPTAGPIETVRLHYTKTSTMFVVPLGILAIVMVVSGVIAGIAYQLGSVPGSAEWVDSSRSSPAILYSMLGFIGYLGVQSVATTFPIGLAFGSTRHAFALGTLLTHALMSAYVALVMLVLLGVELLTGHWFLDLYVFDVNILGAGDPLRLVAIVFLATLATLALGAVFGAAWVRLGAKGPTVLAMGLVLALALALLLLAPSLPDVLAAFELWWLAVAAIVTIALAATGQYLFLRRATVR